MRVVCPYCKTKSSIGRVEKIDQDTQYDLYCSCKNTAECGATFVTTLAFSHTIKPPLRQILSPIEQAKLLIAGMSETEKNALLNDHGQK